MINKQHELEEKRNSLTFETGHKIQELNQAAGMPQGPSVPTPIFREMMNNLNLNNTVKENKEQFLNTLLQFLSQ